MSRTSDAEERPNSEGHTAEGADDVDREVGPDTEDSSGRPRRAPWGRLIGAMLIYTAARFALFLVLLVVIMGAGRVIGMDVPVLVAGILALMLALPLSMVLFTRLRANVNEGIADVTQERREQKAELHRRMAGED